MGGWQVRTARRLLMTLDDLPPGPGLLAAARSVVAELGAADRLLDLVAELASGEGDPEACARLSYRHLLGFDKLLLVDGGPRHMLRAHIWRPGADAPGTEDIHNHRTVPASCVVRGRLAMELYETGGDGGIEATRYRESLSPAPTADWLLEPAGPARLRLVHSAQYTAGSAYALPPHTLHRAWCDSDTPTVTLFLEAGRERRRHTDVFTPAGRHPEVVPKAPLGVADYLAALGSLAELLRNS